MLANLLKENISIRDMASIMEVLADYARLTKDTEILTEYVRHALARQISRQYAQNNIIHCVSLDPVAESLIANNIQRTEAGSYVSLDPNNMQKLLNGLNVELKKMTDVGYLPIIITSPNIRLYFKKLIERSAAGIVVLSHAEIESNTELKVLGVVRI